MSEEIKLTQYSHGAGCGCKIAPKVLDDILKTNFSLPGTEKLLVGNTSKDDAAVYDLGNGTALISTTDFFMPIVDNAHDFGKIASANAISDVYAMGGKPILAIAILRMACRKTFFRTCAAGNGWRKNNLSRSRNSTCRRT
jgi:selenide,water dikinase